MATPCEKADKIDAIDKRIAKIEHLLDDNGQPGLKTIAIRTSQKVDSLIDVVQSIKISTDGLLLFQERMEVFTHNKKEKKNIRQINMRWAIALLASIGISLLALILK